MAEEHDDFVKQVFGTDVSKYVTASILPPAREGGHEKPGIFDVPLQAIGKLVGEPDLGNPNRTFTEDVMHNTVEHFQIKEGDSDGMKLAKAAGIVVTMPLWGPAVVGAAAMDHANQIINDFSEIGTGIQNPDSHGQGSEDAVQAQSPANPTASPQPSPSDDPQQSTAQGPESGDPAAEAPAASAPEEQAN